MMKRCDCGGRYESKVVARYEAGPLLGLETHEVVVVDLPARVCDACGHVAIRGLTWTMIMLEVAMQFCAAPQRLDGEQAQYLRQMLGISQRELADRLALNRVTVAHWERGERPISPQNDYMLRTQFLTTLAKTSPVVHRRMAEILASGVHSGAPVESPAPTVVQIAA